MKKLPGRSLLGIAVLAAICSACDKNIKDGRIQMSGDYIVLAWNDLGMHCLSPSYDELVILPPYNTVWAQVVKRGDPPRVVTEGLTVEYSIANNTYSYGKRDYGGFWDNARALFGTDLEHDLGLNLANPDVRNGLAGTMEAVAGDHFAVHGIPLTPVDDDGTWSPFQVALIAVRDSSGAVVCETQATVPTSDEINCAKCHGGGEPGETFARILETHDEISLTQLLSGTPVLCASCHGSPALGQTGPGSSGTYLSQAIHGFHASKGAKCYDCHPGEATKCNRSLSHTADGGKCTSCHGDMATVASTIAGGERLPWLGEPGCVDCHDGVAQVDTGDTLYRNAYGHGGLACPACHGSPHAMVASREQPDNTQAIRLQGTAAPVGSCRACHLGSHGGGDDFGEVHAGSSPEAHTACNICHEATPSDTSSWPHSFQWK